MRFALLPLVLVLAACGGGGGGSRPAAPAVDPLSTLFLDTTGKTQVSCPVQTPRTFVAVVLGQSNGANTGDQMFASATAINYFNGRCYLATSPMLNTSGDRGSMWPLLAGKLTNRDNIIFITISVGGTSVKEWSNGDMAVRLDDAMKGPYSITDFLWDQGEADSGHITAPVYALNLQAIINKTKANYPQSRFWVTLTSTYNRPPDENVRAGQSAVIGPGVFQGPDTDMFGSTYRLPDNIHFNALGQQAITDVWATLLN